MSKALEVTNVEKVYGGMFGNATRALDGVSFSIDRPTAGSVLIDGTNVTHMRAKQLSTFRREQLGFIFQDSNLLDTLTCRENVALPLTIARVAPAQIDERVERISATLGVREVLDKFPYQASGGQRQRVAACRAMINDPTLVLADEPTGALDSKNSKLLLERFDALNTQFRATILMVTHDTFAASYCRRVLFIRDGKIFTELHRGDLPRRTFFDRIMEVVATMGGGQSDVL